MQATSIHSPKRIFVAGHRGMVGSAIVRALTARGCRDIVTRTHAELDLTDQAAVRAFFQAERIDEVYLAAARVGGIHANDTYPAEFLYQNLMMEANVIHESWKAGVERLLFLGSSCIYPRMAPQPMPEGALLTGALEATNEPYAIAKIAGIKLCESYNRQYGTDYRSVMPTNLYGPGDSYHPENSHVLPAMIRRFHEARITGAPTVTVWGSGTPLRELLHVEDMADACIHVMELDKATHAAFTSPRLSHINVGSGQEVSTAQLAGMVKNAVGYQGEILFDRSKPDGTPRKLVDSSTLARLGWIARIGLAEGIRQTYACFLKEHPEQAGNLANDRRENPRNTSAAAEPITADASSAPPLGQRAPAVETGG
ncbi:MAG: fcl [Herminiimonas sp.]|nr:fcl [Herminiimonas sp.]MDB5853120.1 fcl [Herminiimonas sp.]